MELAWTIALNHGLVGDITFTPMLAGDITSTLALVWDFTWLGFYLGLVCYDWRLTSLFIYVKTILVVASLRPSLYSELCRGLFNPITMCRLGVIVVVYYAEVGGSADLCSQVAGSPQVSAEQF